MTVDKLYVNNTGGKIDDVNESVLLRKYGNKGVGVMAVAGEVTRLSLTPIQRSIIILKGLSMSIDENNNYDDGNGED
jgi:hypothetical protein